MQKILTLFFIIITNLVAKNFTVASYNVENLFDLNHDGSEYKEYIPNTKSNWNNKTYSKKLRNTIHAIKETNADIIALQEIESQAVFDELRKALDYPFGEFSKNKNASIGLGILSHFPITNHYDIQVPHSKVNRPIQAVTINIQNRKLTLFNNHWPSKRKPENERIRYAFALQKHIQTFREKEDYILLGDFNSNYNEFQTIIREERLNNSNGITGINHVLNTTIKDDFVKKTQMAQYKNIVHYNLWLDYDYMQRFSNMYRGLKNTPDNILISEGLLDNSNISYINRSFRVIKPYYLYKKPIIKRWQISKGKHKGLGYSDHLPIMATFSTKAQAKIYASTVTSIKELYNKGEIAKANIRATVIYKNGKNAIIKSNNDRAIYIYNVAEELQLGFTYDLKILRTKIHYGLKEIIKLHIKKELGYDKEYSKLYLNGYSINLHDESLQNEVITNLEGTFNKGYLTFGSEKIRLYSKNKALLPKNGQKITIINAHLGYFKNKAQLIIYKKSDIKVHN